MIDQLLEQAKMQLAHSKECSLPAVTVSIATLEELIRRAELAGAVTPGPSARQIIRERVARLVGE